MLSCLCYFVHGEWDSLAFGFVLRNPTLVRHFPVRYSFYLLLHHCKHCKLQTCATQIEIENIKLLRYNDNQRCIYYKLIEKGEQNGNELQ